MYCEISYAVNIAKQVLLQSTMRRDDRKCACVRRAYVRACERVANRGSGV